MTKKIIYFFFFLATFLPSTVFAIDAISFDAAKMGTDSNVFGTPITLSTTITVGTLTQGYIVLNLSMNDFNWSGCTDNGSAMTQAGIETTDNGFYAESFVFANPPSGVNTFVCTPSTNPGGSDFWYSEESFACVSGVDQFQGDAGGLSGVGTLPFTSLAAGDWVSVNTHLGNYTTGFTVSGGTYQQRYQTGNQESGDSGAAVSGNVTYTATGLFNHSTEGVALLVGSGCTGGGGGGGTGTTTAPISVASVWALSALALVMIIVTVYFAIFFMIFMFISWGLAKFVRAIIAFLHL